MIIKIGSKKNVKIASLMRIGVGDINQVINKMGNIFVSQKHVSEEWEDKNSKNKSNKMLNNAKTQK